MADSSPLPMTNGSSFAKGMHVRVSGAVGARCRHFKHRSISSNALVHCEYLQHKKCHSIGQCREKKEKRKTTACIVSFALPSLWNKHAGRTMPPQYLSLNVGWNSVCICVVGRLQRNICGMKSTFADGDFEFDDVDGIGHAMAPLGQQSCGH